MGNFLPMPPMARTRYECTKISPSFLSVIFYIFLLLVFFSAQYIYIVSTEKGELKITSRANTNLIKRIAFFLKNFFLTIYKKKIRETKKKAQRVRHFTEFIEKFQTVSFHRVCVNVCVEVYDFFFNVQRNAFSHTEAIVRVVHLQGVGRARVVSTHKVEK